MRPQQKMAELCQLTGVKLITSLSLIIIHLNSQSSDTDNRFIKYLFKKRRYGTVMGGLLSEKFLDTNLAIPFAAPALNTPSLQKYKRVCIP